MIPHLTDEQAPLEVLLALLERWHGLETSAPQGMNPLAWWCELLDRNPDLFGETHNSFVAPPEAVEDDPFLVWSGNGVAEVPRPSLRIFYVEHQGVLTWATEESAEMDPGVWVRHGDRYGTVGWSRERDRLSRVLLKAAILESMLGPVEGGGIEWLERSTWDRIKSRDLTRMPFASAPKLWPDFFQAGDYLAALFEESGDDVRVVFASPDEGALGFLYDEVDNPWDFGLD